MNQYGRMAQRHWRRHRPEGYRTIRDPVSFFSTLGQEAAQQIENLSLELAGDDPPGETYRAKLGRLRMARLQAEETVLREWVLPPPEDDKQEEAEAATGASQGLLPLVEDPTDPRWRQMRAEHEEMRLREREQEPADPQ